MVNKHILPTEQTLTEPLTLGLFLHLRCARKERIMADLPLCARVNLQGDNVAKQSRAKRHPTGSGVRGLGHLAAGEHLLQAELDLASELDGPGHVDHGAGFRANRAPLGDVDSEDGVGITVGYGVGAAWEGAMIALSSGV